jgi:hypothetical protein
MVSFTTVTIFLKLIKLVRFSRRYPYVSQISHSAATTYSDWIISFFLQPELLKTLSDILVHGGHSAVARRQAGLQLKNRLMSNDEATRSVPLISNVGPQRPQEFGCPKWQIYYDPIFSAKATLIF